MLEFDRAKNKITRFDLTALGDFSGRWFAGNKGWKEATTAAPLPLGFAFEVDQTAYQLPPEQRRPRSFMHASGSPRRSPTTSWTAREPSRSPASRWATI